MKPRLTLWLTLTIGILFMAVGVELALAQEVPEALPPGTSLSPTLNTILQIILGLVTIAAGIIGALWGKGRIAVNNVIRDRVENEHLQGLLMVVNDTAFGVAEGLYDDVVKDLKEKNKRRKGKLTKEDVAELKTLSVDRMKERLPATVLDALELHFGIDLDGLLGDSVKRAAQLSKERNLNGG